MENKRDYVPSLELPYVTKIDMGLLTQRLYGEIKLPGSREIGAACNCDCCHCD